MRCFHSNKRIFLLLSVLLFAFFQSAIAQNSSKQQLLIKEAQQIYTSKPNEALKIATLLLNNNASIEEQSEINFLIAKIYKQIGDYPNFVQYLFQASKNSEEISPYLNAKINNEKAVFLANNFLQKQAVFYQNEVKKQGNEIKNPNEKIEILTTLYLQEFQEFIQKNDLDKAKIIYAKHKNFTLLTKNKTFSIPFLLLETKFFILENKFESAFQKLNHLETLFNSEKQIDLYLKSQYLIETANLYFIQKDYQKAIVFSDQALSANKPLNNLYSIENAYKIQILSYLAMNNDTEYKRINNQIYTIKNEIVNKEEETINSVYNLINQEFQDKQLKKKNTFTNQLYFVIAAFFLIVFGCFSFWYKNYATKKRFSEIINFLEITRKKGSIIEENTIVTTKKTSIPIETEQQLLAKLKKFESSSKFTNKEMSLSVLAAQFDTNTKYLSEIINKHYQVNFNTYINKLRINFIVEKLKNEPNFINYKISYLADSCGFSSHSSFATVFKSITGISPITFIDLLKKERDHEPNAASNENES